MSEVREQLVDVLGTIESNHFEVRNRHFLEAGADAILERWDLVSKPVVTAEELGKMVKVIGPVQIDIYSAAVVGKRMLDQLDAAGLVIVRREEVE